MDPGSRLSLQQVIDDKISAADVNHILKSLDDAPEDDFIQRLNELGIIDNLMKKVRTTPSANDLPQHVTEKKSSVLKFVDVETDRVVQSDTGLVPNGISQCQKYLLVEIESGHSFIDDFTIMDNESKNTIQIHVAFNKQRFRTEQISMVSNPVFNEGFLFSVGESTHDDMSDIEQLLSMQESVSVLVVKTDAAGDTTVISHEAVEWRSVLAKSQSITVNLKGRIFIKLSRNSA